MRQDSYFMTLALEQARLAASMGEAPVGAVICRSDEVIALGHNRRETDKSALAHAEIMAIDAACKKLGGWRLFDCELFVTLEPCPMCAGAIINARIKRVVFGAFDPKAGCFGTLCDFSGIPFNHKPEVAGGLMEEECASILKDFFASLRSKA